MNMSKNIREVCSFISNDFHIKGITSILIKQYLHFNSSAEILATELVINSGTIKYKAK